jgi:hypothetical protein
LSAVAEGTPTGVFFDGEDRTSLRLAAGLCEGVAAPVADDDDEDEEEEEEEEEESCSGTYPSLTSRPN